MDKTTNLELLSNLMTSKESLVSIPSINKNFKELIKGTLFIDGDFVCVIKSLQAEICSPNEISEGEEGDVTQKKKALILFMSIFYSKV